MWDFFKKWRQSYARLPLNAQIMWPVTILFGLSFLISLYLALNEVEIKKDINLKEALKVVHADIENIEKTSQYFLQLAYWFAQSPEVQKALQAKDRSYLLKVTLPIFKSLNEHSPYPLFVHFHIPPGISFLRLWKPDRYGDNISPFRETVVSVLSTGQPAHGIEAGRVGLAVRGLAPILGRDKKHIIGSVEVFCLLRDLLAYLNQDQPEGQIALYLKEKVKPTASVRKYNRIGDFLVSKPPSVRYKNLIKEDFLEEAFRHQTIKQIDSCALIGVPIKDFSNKEVAVYVYFYNMSFLEKEKLRIIKQHVIPASIFYLIALVIISLMVYEGVVGPINKLKIEIEKVSKTIGRRLRDSVSEIVMPITTSREISSLGKAISKLIYELDELASFRQAIEIDRDTEAIYKRLSIIFKEKLGLSNFAIFEVSNSQNQIILKLADPPEQSEEIVCHGNMFDASLCRVVRSAQEVSSFHFTENCEYFYEKDINYICLPIVASGKVIGVVRFLLPLEHSLEEKKRIIDEVVAYLREVAPILESKRFAQGLKEMSMRDALTGLYNRRILDDLLPQVEAGIRRRGSTLGVLMLDLDHFKTINDTYGHAFGDRVLSQVAAIVRGTLRRSDIPVRYGGEEFLLLLPDTTDEGAERAAERIRSKVAAETFIFDGQAVRVTVSIGVAVFPEDDEQIDRVIKFADVALYQAKSRGRNCVVRFKRDLIEKEKD